MGVELADKPRAEEGLNDTMQSDILAGMTRRDWMGLVGVLVGLTLLMMRVTALTAEANRPQGADHGCPAHEHCEEYRRTPC